MRMSFALTLGVMAVTSLTPASAQNPKVIGTWVVSQDRDRFSGEQTAMAITGQAGFILALRCMQGKLTFAVRNSNDSGDSYSPGEVFAVQYKGGSHPVATTMGDAVSQQMVEVFVTDEIRASLLTSNEFAFRFTGQTITFDAVFDAGTAARSLLPVLNACPPEGAKGGK